MRALSISILLLWALSVQSQTLTALVADWDDLSQWTIYTTDEDERGELRLRNPLQPEPTAWNYRIGEQSGQIKLLQNGPFPEWEIRGDNIIATARPLFGNDTREWRISGPGAQVLTFKSRFGNVLYDWEVRDEQRGYFGTYMTYEGDPREWEIIDETDESVSLPERLLMLFVATFYGSRR